METSSNKKSTPILKEREGKIWENFMIKTTLHIFCIVDTNKINYHLLVAAKNYELEWNYFISDGLESSRPHLEQIISSLYLHLLERRR